MGILTSWPRKIGEADKEKTKIYLVEDLVTLWGWLVQLCDGGCRGRRWLLAWIARPWDGNCVILVNFSFPDKKNSTWIGKLLLLGDHTAPLLLPTSSWRLRGGEGWWKVGGGHWLGKSKGRVAHQGVGGGVGGGGVVQLVPRDWTEGRDWGWLLQSRGGKEVLMGVGLLGAWHPHRASKAPHLGEAPQATWVPRQAAQTTRVAKVHTTHRIRGESQKRVATLE